VLRAALLSALLLGLLMTTGCWPATQSQTLSAAPTATTVAVPTSKPAATAKANGEAKPTATTARPTAVAAKPPPSPPSAPSSGQAGQATAPSPTAAPAAAKPAASPPAVVATSVAGLPAIAASPAPKPGDGDALGVAASAGSAAAANVSDPEATALCGPGAVLSTRAGQAVGRSATVAIARVDASFQANTRGQPTFLNDAPYPNHAFTAVIWGNDRRQFNPPPEGAWQGKALCVSGPVELFQQRPQIVVSSPSQLRAAR